VFEQKKRPVVSENEMIICTVPTLVVVVFFVLITDFITYLLIYFLEKKDNMLLVPLAAHASAFSFAVTKTFYY